MRRREFLRTTLGVAVASSASTGLSLPAVAADDSASKPGGRGWRIAPFRFDVTPPTGHSLCGGWIRPVIGVDDPLEAVGFVLLDGRGAVDPIVICAVDWTGILNDAHIEWRRALAIAAGTTPERVAVQCVHQHNAPFACLDSERIVDAQGDLPHIVDVAFFRRCLERGQRAIRGAIPKARPLTHVGTGRGKVDRVASNRRILGADGKVEHWRGSSSRIS